MLSTEILPHANKGLQTDYHNHQCQCISRKDAAKLLGITPHTFDHLMRNGKLKFTRCWISKKRQGYSHKEIIDFLKEFRIGKICRRYAVIPNSLKTLGLF